jgi:hypothetical protein
MGQVSSQAFNLADGNYLYLYQANNTGSTVLDVLSVYPTYGLLSAGSLSANAPTGFLAGGTLPSGVSWDQALGANNLEYDYFPSAGGSIAVGSHSVAMYMISSYSPIVGEGFVIDSGVAMVSAVVAPEPATLGFLAIGLAAGLARRLRRR